MSLATALLTAVTGEFQRTEPLLPGAGEPWLRERRGAALAQFATIGLPSSRQERWRHTDVAPIAAQSYRLGPAGQTAAAAVLARHDVFPAIRLVFVDGWLDASRSDIAQLPAGVAVTPLPEAIERRDPLVGERLRARMNTAADGFQLLQDIFLGGGAVIDLAAGAAPELPLHLCFVHGEQAEATMSHPRVLVRCGANARLRLVESYLAAPAGPYLQNALTEIELCAGATVTHYRIQREGEFNQHIGRLLITQNAASSYDSFVFTSGAALSRQEITCNTNGAQANCRLRGLYLADRRQLMDHHLCVEHAQAETRSESHYRGIAGGNARAVFNGRIVVRPDAQRINAQLQNRNLLLSPRAEIDTKPELEIYADDVQCAHGATVGQLDREALFYLRSRGIPREVAQAMLTLAFAADLLAAITIPELHAALSAELSGHLSGVARLPEVA
jgi:Fe-S cluster assembly protein SufD